MIYNAYQDTKKGLFGMSVVSCGHIFAQQGRTINRPNGRSDYLLFYVAKGSEFVSLSDEVELTEGSFVLFRPFEKQIHTQKSPKVSEFYYIHFNAPDDFDLFGFESSVAYFNKPSTKVKELFEDIINELQSKQPSYEEICASKLFNVFFLLKRRFEKLNSPLGQYADKISFVIQTMNREFEKNYSLEDYAQMCCMSKYHFLRIFKDITGVTPIEYRNSIRLEHAKEALCEGESTIEEVGARVGYSSSAYFCSCFKEKFGLSPSEFRKKYR